MTIGELINALAEIRSEHDNVPVLLVLDATATQDGGVPVDCADVALFVTDVTVDPMQAPAATLCVCAMNGDVHSIFRGRTS